MDHTSELSIDGAWAPSTRSEPITVASPHRGEVVAQASAAGPGDVDRAVAADARACDDGPWLPPARGLGVFVELESISVAAG